MVPDTLVRVPEMLDTPPSQNNHAFIIFAGFDNLLFYCLQ